MECGRQVCSGAVCTFHGDGTNKIYSKKLSIWEEAAKFLKNMCGSVKTSKKLHFVCMIYVFLSNQSINQSIMFRWCLSINGHITA